MNNQEGIQIDFRTLVAILWRAKIFIISITILFSIGTVLFSLSLPNIYRSEALVSIVENEDSSLSGLSSKFGGLASIAGINIQSQSGSKREVALETLKSRSFIKRFINDNKLKPIILAAKDWEPKNNELVYDPEIYEVKSQKWVREVSFPKTQVPSDIEAYRFFMKENLNISEDKDTSFVYISVNHFSPYIAKEILDKIIISINDELRKVDIEEANKSVAFLQQKIEETKNVDMRKIMFDMIETQVQNQMLAEVRDEYIFKTIDPAIADEIKFSPKRAVLCIMGFIIGFFFSVLCVLVSYIYKEQKVE
ncbi:Wzz/FepE/Etk N-terminal domain-containing protein [Pseudoalteromonas sp. JSTW]|uniref:Wzz/FepE/Etk N-terminal domain-containing protein n=1 Tax=Pseudoalteromonas sp. JSTW TaxID=2752475 RepID=UPI0015D5469F|nr:Wzz/FepE/Etk N-terminal domain-containing protein [Pseudoalteromonas sp. JSTW]QLJ08010.1 LPS O-antigen length regulator [Pseudoalteromonas sp. JSTW]